MQCVLCKHGETKHGSSSLMFDHEGKKYYVDQVPAEVCVTCGEPYFDTKTLTHLRNSFDDVTLPAIPMEARHFQPQPELRPQ